MAIYTHHSLIAWLISNFIQDTERFWTFQNQLERVRRSLGGARLCQRHQFRRWQQCYSCLQWYCHQLPLWTLVGNDLCYFHLQKCNVYHSNCFSLIQIFIHLFKLLFILLSPFCCPSGLKLCEEFWKMFTIPYSY